MLTLWKDKLPGSTSTGPNDVELVDTSKRQIADRLKTCPSLMVKMVIWTSLSSKADSEPIAALWMKPRKVNT